MTEGFIAPHGGYKKLFSYRKAEMVYDATVCFCKRFLKKYDRTYDQMIQAARSRKQNIIEGSQASGTSKKIEIKLTSVARASLEELLADYHDFLRVRRFSLWDKNSKAAKAVRKLAYRENESYETYKSYIEIRSPETVANIIICLIHQANYLLDRHLRYLEKEFVKMGGFSERMTQARLKYRKKNKGYPEKNI